MKFTHIYWAPRLDLTGYKKALDAAMREVLAQGLMAWLEAVVAEVPVWSGASRATFVKIASRIGASVPIGGAPAAVDRTAMGMAASTGEMVMDANSGLYVFKYGTDLPWLVWNELHNANVDPDPTLFAKLKKPGPYEFQVKGAAAFLHNTSHVSLPVVAPHIRSTRVR